MSLIIWDRMFGTFVEERPQEPVRYGLTKSVKSRGLVNIVVHEWKDIWHDVKNARDWRERFGFVFGRPGWKPECEEKLHAIERAVDAPQLGSFATESSHAKIRQ